MTNDPHRATTILRESAIDELRRRYDEQLSLLQAKDAGHRLRAVLEETTCLYGDVKIGSPTR